MSIKRMALVAGKFIRGFAVWDGIQTWEPAGYTPADTTDQPNLAVGVPFHDRLGNPYTYNVVIDGNSLAIADYGVTVNSCADGAIAAGLTQYDVINMARNGYQTSVLVVSAPTYIDNLYEAALGGKNISILWEGTNDISLLNKTDVEAFAAIQAYCEARKLKGFRTIVGTLLPRNGSANPNQETYRLSVNTMLRDALASGAAWLGSLADVASSSLIGDAGDQNNGTYYTDGLHLTTAGHTVASTYFRDAVLREIAREEHMVLALVMEHTFSSHLNNDVQTIGQIPAGARTVGGFYQIQQGYTYTEGDELQCDIGTVADPAAFSWFTPIVAGDTPELNNPILRGGHLYSVATDVKITHKENTVNMSGAKMLVVLLYVLE